MKTLNDIFRSFVDGRYFLLFGFWFILIFHLGYDYVVYDMSVKYKSEIGKTIVIYNDSLIITDYNTFGEKFILSNGTTIDYKLLMNLLNKQ